MAIARTNPDEFRSNLSRWAEWAGLRNIPIWLKHKTADEKAFRWSARMIIALCLIGIPLLLYWILIPATQTLIKASELPQIPFEDKEVHGWLRPANAITPPNGCDGLIAPNAIRVLIGDNTVAQDGFGKVSVLQIGRCEALSIERSSELDFPHFRRD